MDKTKAVLLVLPILLALSHAIDVHVGQDVVLECRFNPALLQKEPTLYWIRANARDKDNVAIGANPLEHNYKINYKPKEGHYDLLVSGATYDRDNGKFECRLKEPGTGQELHSQLVELTVLIPPGNPQITPANPVAVEGQPVELVCSSAGGSPDPILRWYRKGEPTPLEAITKAGGSRNVPTTSTLTVRPEKGDDGAEYRCVAWNRAINQEDKKEATVQLTVNYAPRVTVGPQNPIRVERGSSAQLTCSVDAKPAVSNVRWMRNGRFLATTFNHTLRSVSLDDSGTYICSADNGLGTSGEAELRVEVMYAPVVTVEFRREVEAGASVSISCNVSSNPAPVSVEWVKENDGEFKASGEVLRLSRVTAAQAGRYFCRATNIINGIERSGNASIQFLVKHEPGVTKITPEGQIAVEGTSVTLRCEADPPGWPTPQYRWWRSGAEGTALAVTQDYTIPVTRQDNEGTYYCQPSNELGAGTPASIMLKVYQAPKIVTPLQNVIQKKAGDTDFSLTCSAQGKPKPSITWLKNGVEIPTNQQTFDIKIEESEGRNSIFTVRSTLRFQGAEREQGSQLSADDRGVYSCAFQNHVSRVDSSVTLKVEHSPIFLDHKPKVAYNTGSSAFLKCLIQAYPRPNVEWSFRDSLILNDGVHHEMNVTALENDVYQGLLHIAEMKDSDYGDYMCRVWNSEGEQAAKIHLQPTSEPEKPTNLRLVQAGYDSVTLEWDQGFNGGYDNTIFNVIFKSNVDGTTREYDCQSSNPCTITGLEQLQSYAFQVKAVNSKGESGSSNTLTASTILDLSRIPEPQRVTFDPKTKTISFYVDSAFNLIGFVEVRNGNGDWQLAQKVPARIPISREVLDQVGDDTDELRLKLCLEVNITLCSDPVLARPGELLPSEPTKAYTDFPTKYMIAIVVACIVGSLVLILIFVFFCYRRRRAQKLKKILELEKAHSTARPTVSQQPPPPYYAGLDNKGRDQGLDTSLEDPAKNLYATHAGYGYHHNAPNGNFNNGGDWVNMTYTEQSYSNSNNGGSVNSQDSLWQLKNNAEVPHDRSYHYDPITHGGYGGFEDYSHYPVPSENYLSQHSRDYAPANGDPYGAVHKPGKLAESPYHNVSGMPDPYMEAQGGEDNKAQHISMSFDESLESGYSTPNSRNRRVIREIIV